MWSVLPQYLQHFIVQPVLLIFSSVSYNICMASLPRDPVRLGNWHQPISDSSLVFWSPSISSSTNILLIYLLIYYYPHLWSFSWSYYFLSKGCDALSVSAFDMISDHFSVVDDLRFSAHHSRTVPWTIMYRKLEAIDIEACMADIKNSELIRYPKTNAIELSQQ